jgi:hypothetical protein
VLRGLGCAWGAVRTAHANMPMSRAGCHTSRASQSCRVAWQDGRHIVSLVARTCRVSQRKCFGDGRRHAVHLSQMSPRCVRSQRIFNEKQFWHVLANSVSPLGVLSLPPSFSGEGDMAAACSSGRGSGAGQAWRQVWCGCPRRRRHAQPEGVRTRRAAFKSRFPSGSRSISLGNAIQEAVRQQAKRRRVAAVGSPRRW